MCSSDLPLFYKLFLDDERNPFHVAWVKGHFPGPWVVVRNYDQFVKEVTERGLPAHVSFDHDLADEHYRKSMYDPDKHYSNYYTDGTFKEKTGFDCAKWLVELTATLNFFVFVAGIANAFEVDVPEDGDPIR